jgi:ABC-type nitrate/sulfonate/bicarbonate transport system substrate-binding protein
MVGSREVDYMYSAGTALRVAARGLPSKVVAYTLKNILFYLMAQPNIRSIQELKGKKIAVALPSDTGGLATKATLKANGLDPDRDVTYIAIGAASIRLAAIEAGSIEASIMPVPWNIRMKQKGFNELAFAGDYMKEPLTGFSASNEKLEKNPQQVRRVLRGFLRSMRAFRQDSKDATDFIARRSARAGGGYRVLPNCYSISERRRHDQPIGHPRIRRQCEKRARGENATDDFRSRRFPLH